MSAFSKIYPALSLIQAILDTKDERVISLVRNSSFPYVSLGGVHGWVFDLASPVVRRLWLDHEWENHTREPAPSSLIYRSDLVLAVVVVPPVLGHVV